MTDSSGNAESSFLMWLLAMAVATLALHVALGWARECLRERELRRQWRPALMAAAVLGTGLGAAVVLALAGEALAFALGYRYAMAGALWAAAVAGSFVLCFGIVLSRRWWGLMLCGLLLAGLVLGLQAGWITAAGFRPGVVWRPEFVAAAAIVEIVTAAAGLWLAFSDLGHSGALRRWWRLGGVVLVALGIVAGQALLTSGIGMPAQVGSIYARELPGTVLSLLCGVLLPLVLAMLALDLALRRSDGKRRRRDGGGNENLAPVTTRRRKRRHRIRAL